MNRDKPEKTDKDCVVCGSAVEVGSAWSRCSNRDCPTRADDDCNLSTDSTVGEIADYWKDRALEAEQDGPTQEEVDLQTVSRYREFLLAESPQNATKHEGAVNALLPFSSFDGWGELKIEVGE